MVKRSGKKCHQRLSLVVIGSTTTQDANANRPAKTCAINTEHWFFLNYFFVMFINMEHSLNVAVGAGVSYPPTVYVHANHGKAA